MKKLVTIINLLVFLFASMLVMSIFYEGITLEWYAFVPVLILITDFSFIIATILNLIINRKVKILFWLNIFSCLLIGIAIVMKIIHLDNPPWAMVFWHFYILYFYGIQTVIALNNRAGERLSGVNRG